MVTRLDRLARSTRDLLNTLAVITGKEAGFRSLADAGPTRRRPTVA
jgi:DNA invertase Pin-like site-specific DNA recombinase